MISSIGRKVILAIVPLKNEKTINKANVNNEWFPTAKLPKINEYSKYY